MPQLGLGLRVDMNRRSGGVPFKNDLSLLASGRNGLTIPASVGDDLDILLPSIHCINHAGLQYIDGTGVSDIYNTDFSFVTWAKADAAGGNYIAGKATNGTYAYGRYMFTSEVTTQYLSFVISAQG